MNENDKYAAEENSERQWQWQNTSSENPDAGGSSDQNEYSYRRDEIPHRSYVDANYHSEGDLAQPRSYYTPPKAVEKQRKEKKTLGMGRFIAACLICALLGGLGGGALVSAFSPAAQAPGVYGGGSLQIGDSTPLPNTISLGDRLTGAEIYALGCTQAVGVTTEITSRDFFGMETSSAVSGSGFIVTDNGYVVTNYHVIQPAYLGKHEISVILNNGESYPAEIVGFEKDNDIAVLKINMTGLPAATLGNSDNLQVGDPIYAIGNPLGLLNFSMSTGAVSALNRLITTRDPYDNSAITNNMFQIDAAVNGGNSGGPVYNDRGEVVGIVTAKNSQSGVEGIGFAIPINDVIDMIKDFVEIGYISGRASFGIVATNINDVSASYYNTVPGAEVKTVNPGSCAEKAGILVGDVITALGDEQVTSLDSLLAAKGNYKPGDTTTVTVYRDGEYKDLTITFDEDTGISSSLPSQEDNGESGLPLEEDGLPDEPDTDSQFPVNPQES